MSINENNITDIDDSTVLENTPMMVVEQGGNSYAIPLMGGGGIGKQVQANWTQTDDTAVDYIKNKPEIAPGMALQTVITDTTSTAPIIAKMEANTRYVFTEPLTSLTVSSVEDSNFESEIQFVSGNAITVSLPDGLRYAGYVEFKTNTNYIINIKNSIAVVVDYE